MIVHVMHTALADGDDLFRLLIAAHWPSGFDPTNNGRGVIKRLAAYCRSLTIWHTIPFRLNAWCGCNHLAAPATLIDAVLHDDPFTPHSTALLLSEVLNLGRMADRTCTQGRSYLDHHASTSRAAPTPAAPRSTTMCRSNRRRGAPRPIRCPTANPSYLID